ncbi:MAG: dual specificity protein phosphatase family protein [Gemmataceae bacterium]|jgi:atypical dual specificity phosphatase|nr:dual specificity protein phosphatase family protein [Gemmataceae bacterium]
MEEHDSEITPPHAFSWVQYPLLAACAAPETPEELVWLRQNRIDILITLTENSLPRKWIDHAGLMSVHIPIPDMEAPTTQQFRQALSVIEKAHQSKMGVCVHCWAGRGRTGTILAGYFVSQGLSPKQAITKVRQLRPGSIEVSSQEQAIYDFAKEIS